MKCFNDECPEVLATHGRRIYCYKCRAVMNRWALRRPAEVVDYSKRMARASFRLTHIAERKLDAPIAKAVLRRNGNGNGKKARK